MQEEYESLDFDNMEFTDIKTYAEQGNEKAQKSLGNCYYKGNGVEQSYQEAVKWYKLSAEQGNSDAMRNLGICFMNGYGVQQSNSEALKFLKLASESGNVYAQKDLEKWQAIIEKQVSNEKNKLVESYSESNKTISKRNEEKHFNLYGKTLEVSDGRQKYNDIRKIFVNEAIKRANQFENIYRQQNHNLDDVAQYAYEQGSNCITPAISLAVDVLVRKGIYDIDQNKFINHYYMKYHTWDEDFGKINDKYMEIVLKSTDLDNYRRVRRENRGRIVGGGFGLEGAAKGMVQAGAINAFFGAGHMAFNGVAKLVSISIDSYKKSKIFNDSETLETLKTGVYNAVFNVLYALIDVIRDRLYSSQELYGIPSNDDIEKADSIFNNIKQGKIEKSIFPDMYINILELYPYECNYYDHMLLTLGDKNKNLSKIAEYFGIDINKLKADLLSTLVNGIKEPKSENEALHSIDMIKSLISFLEVSNNSEIYSESMQKIKDLESKREEFDIINRTVDGIIYETKEEVELVLEERVIIKQMISQGDTKTEQGAIELLNELINKNFKTESAIKYIEDVRLIVEQFEIDSRTVDGLIYKSKEEAALAAEELEELEEIKSNSDLSTIEGVKTALSIIERKNFQTKAYSKFYQHAKISLANLEKKAMTVNGKLYDTIEQAEFAKQEFEKKNTTISKEVNNNLKNKKRIKIATLNVRFFQINFIV